MINIFIITEAFTNLTGDESHICLFGVYLFNT